MKTRLALLLAAPTLLATSLMSQSANAFCIYNTTASPLLAQQTALIGKQFRHGWSGMTTTLPAAIAPLALGQSVRQQAGLPSPKSAPSKVCCNWQEKSCNPEGFKATTLYTQLRVKVTAGTSIGLGRVGGEGYNCGQQDAQGNETVPHEAGGWVTVEPSPKFDKTKEPSSRNPPYIAKVFTENATPNHTKTFPCPAAPRSATWSDLIPDWSDVIAG